jgi:hypothetical protein
VGTALPKTRSDVILEADIVLFCAVKISIGPGRDYIGGLEKRVIQELVNYINGFSQPPTVLDPGLPQGGE